LLKCLWTPTAVTRFLACYDRMADTYLGAATWEPREDLEARAALLLPGLLLARVDGKSPVEYVTEEADKARIRRVARSLLLDRPERLDTVRYAWAAELGV
jgi:hypothetical protein